MTARDEALHAPAQGNPYDSVPYDTTPFAYTQPTRLAALGRLFGMSPADVRTARVLELGCARGDNLLPLAAKFPKAQFVGVDYSEVQILAADAMKADIGLKNVEFRNMSIADIGADLGKFDFIICHGVLSWVAEPIRAAIFRVCKENLAPAGIAMVSYNTFPGWHQARAVRDMMLYHTANFADPVEKVAQAKVLIKFLLEGVAPEHVAYREFLSNELGILESNPDSYVLHDHLEETNQPFYFHEVAGRANAIGLDYLADSNIETMYPANFKPVVAAALAATDDIVRIEQYLDFVSNRRFRISLFCHAGTALARKLDFAQIFEFDIESAFPPLDPAKIDLTVDSALKFTAIGGTTVDTTNRFAAAVMVELSNLHGRTARADAVVAKALAALGRSAGKDGPERVRTAMLELGMALVLGGALRLHSAANDFPIEPGEKPRAFAPALAAARAGRSTVWNQIHSFVRLAPVEIELLSACDGAHDRAALVDKILAQVEGGKLVLNMNNSVVLGSSARKDAVAQWIDSTLGQFGQRALLV